MPPGPTLRRCWSQRPATCCATRSPRSSGGGPSPPPLSRLQRHLPRGGRDVAGAVAHLERDRRRRLPVLPHGGSERGGGLLRKLHLEGRLPARRQLLALQRGQ